MAYSISQCSVGPEHVCILTHAFDARTYTKWVNIRHTLSVNTQIHLSMRAVSHTHSLLAQKQNGLTYGIFYQSMLRRDLVYVWSRHSIRCSHIHRIGILSVNAQTRLSMHAGLSKSFAARTYTIWVKINA